MPNSHRTQSAIRAARVNTSSIKSLSEILAINGKTDTPIDHSNLSALLSGQIEQIENALDDIEEDENEPQG